MKQAEPRPGEAIAAFLKFLETAKQEYESVYAAVGAEDNKVQTFLHDLEFAPDRNERNRIAARLQKSRQARRKAKDRVQLYENVYKFCTDKQGQNFIKALEHLQKDRAMMENYLFGERKFKKRVE